MAVQPALKMWSRQGSSADAVSNFRGMDVAVTEAYQILHDVDTPEFDKYLAPGLPEVGQVYPGTNFVLAERARMEQVSPIMTVATVDYRGELPANQNPLLARPLVDWSAQLSSEEIDEDIFGKRIQTKPGERIRGITADFPDIILTVRRNFSSWSSYAQAAFLRATNSTPFAGWPAGTGRVIDLSASSRYGDAFIGQGYWEATLRVKFRVPYRTTPDKAWYARVSHQGLFCFKKMPGPPNSSGQYPVAIVPCVDDHKSVATSPKALDINGFQVPDNDERFHSWLEFARYIPMNLNLLGFL